jgi:hypothetical protein
MVREEAPGQALARQDPGRLVGEMAPPARQSFDYPIGLN